MFIQYYREKWQFAVIRGQGFYNFQLKSSGKVENSTTKPASQNSSKYFKSTSASTFTSETEDKLETVSMSSGDCNDNKEDLDFKGSTTNKTKRKY